ncbi:hypothetical protein [Candidatus Methanodesulfokora washburnensis]|jgi:hypothetical protein|nr:hypothetical protein [Candidatus Methanodesulfokores washburnensis]
MERKKTYSPPLIRKYSVFFSLRPEEKFIDMRRKSGKSLKEGVV